MRLLRFGDVILPTYNRIADDSTFPSIAAYDDTLEDEYDEWSSDQAPDDGREIEVEARVYESTASAKQVTVNALRAMRGKRDVLYGEDDTDNILWCYARLLEIEAQRRKGTLVQQLRMRFHLAPGGFNGDRHSAGWQFNASPPVRINDGRQINESVGAVFTLDGSPKTCAVTNGGNRAVVDTTLTIALPGAGTAITVVAVEITGVSYVEWQGTLSPGSSLVFDCGALSVEIDGNDVYDELMTLDDSQTVVPWFVLEPGANSVIITTVGGGGANPATATFDFRDRWE